MVFQKGNKINLGKKFSEEHKRKISIAKKGCIPWNKGKTGVQVHSEETKRKIGLTGKGRKHSEETKLKMSLNHTYSSGKEHYLWKGGRVIDGKGYIRIYKPEHPFANKDKYVYEHRLIMEKFLGRYLTKVEIVHHVNKIVADNRIENLELMDIETHNSLHKTKKVIYATI